MTANSTFGPCPRGILHLVWRQTRVHDTSHYALTDCNKLYEEKKQGLMRG